MRSAEQLGTVPRVARPPPALPRPPPRPVRPLPAYPGYSPAGPQAGGSEGGLAGWRAGRWPDCYPAPDMAHLT